MTWFGEVLFPFVKISSNRLYTNFNNKCLRRCYHLSGYKSTFKFNRSFLLNKKKIIRLNFSSNIFLFILFYSFCSVNEYHLDFSIKWMKNIKETHLISMHWDKRSWILIVVFHSNIFILIVLDQLDPDPT